VKLARITGARRLRGEALTLSGPAEQLSARPIAERMVTLARQRVDAHARRRPAHQPRPAARRARARRGLGPRRRRENGDAGDGLGGPPLPGTGAEGRLALPGVRG
jgi:hypothetical protein